LTQRPEPSGCAVQWGGRWNEPEVTGVIFSDSVSALVPKFIESESVSEKFQIWESDSCSDSGYHRSNRNLLFFCI